MILGYVATCIILVWPHLASLEVLDGRDGSEDLPGNDMEKVILGQSEEDEEATREKSFWHVKNRGRAPVGSLAESDAGSGNGNENYLSLEERRIDVTAHGHGFNLKGALTVMTDSDGRSKSAAVALQDKTESKTRSKYPRGWARKRRRRKKRRAEVEEIAKSTPEDEKDYGNEDGDNDEDENDDGSMEDVDGIDLDDMNGTELGSYLGSPCDKTCNAKLLHVLCDPDSRVCECEKKYPVRIGVGRGCAKPKQLGDQCFYAQTCSFSDPNAICMQINHNAICQCKPGFHSVALRRGTKRSFCSEDQVVVSTDLPTLLGVATGIAVLTGLICFVLKLFNSNRYPNRRHYGNANIPPPLLLSSDNQWINGIPLTVHGRPSSRSSSQRSTTNLAYYSRSKGVLVPASRAGAARAAAILLIPCHLQSSKASDAEVAIKSRKDECDAQGNDKEHFSHPGSRRPSLSSIRSTTSSQKSMTYSARRFEQENQQKEQRAAMKAAREEAARLAAPPTPSPLSTDELLPAGARTEEDDPLGFGSSTTKSTSPRNDSASD